MNKNELKKTIALTSGMRENDKMRNSVGILFVFETILLSVMLFITACTSAQNGTAIDNTTQPFTLPEIPSALTSTDDRAEYLVTHYWDNYDFADTTLISRPEITEQEFVNFIDLLPHVPINTALKAITHVMDAAMNAGMPVFTHFAGMSEKYLYDPNSPFRNEEYYIPVLLYIVSSDKIDAVDKVHPQYQLKMAMKNRPGDRATDFTYTLTNDKSEKMSAIKADYTILFFNNPDCHDCKRVKDYMAVSPVFASFYKNECIDIDGKAIKLAILAVYIDNDIPLWLSADYPKIMINSYDSAQIINNGQLYDLKAIPTLYLLDKEKRIILKDAKIEAIEQYLSNIVKPTVQ